MHFPNISLKKIFISTGPIILSSSKSCNITHTLLLSISLVGAVHSFSLFVIGRLGNSFLTFFLSSGCAIGGYMAQRAAMQKTFATISEEMQQSNKILKTENSTLANTNIELKNSVDELAKETALLTFQRKNYEQIAIQLQKLADTSSQDSAENTIAIKTQIESLKEQVKALEQLETQIFPKISTIQESSLEELKKLKELFTQLVDPKTTLQRLEKIETSIAQLTSLTTQIQNAEKALEERIKEIKIHNTILAQHEQAHTKIIAAYKQQTENFRAENDRLSDTTKGLLLNVIG